MNNNELNEKADLIFSIVFSKQNQTKSNEEIKELIKPVLLEISSNERRIGRVQILNHIENSCKDLRSTLVNINF